MNKVKAVLSEETYKLFRAYRKALKGELKRIGLNPDDYKQYNVHIMLMALVDPNWRIKK